MRELARELRTDDKAAERMLRVLIALAEFGLLTSEQIDWLFFRENPSLQRVTGSPVREWLYRLYTAGLVERVLEISKPSYYFLTRKAARFLRQYSELSPPLLANRRRKNDAKPAYHDHLRKTNDFRIAVTLSCQKNGIKLVEWLDERTLRRIQKPHPIKCTLPDGTALSIPLYADGYFILETHRPFHLFLETDEGTETGRPLSSTTKATWIRKILMYQAFLDKPHKQTSSLFEWLYGATSARVVTATTSEERLENLKAITEEVGGQERYWFTTFARFKQQDILADDT